MKKISMIIYSFILIGCSRNSEEKPNIATVKGVPIILYTIDSCEYIGNFESTYAIYSLTHKGNCKYCTQRNKN